MCVCKETGVKGLSHKCNYITVFTTKNDSLHNKIILIQRREHI